MVKIEECFELGYISKPHSFKGQVKAELDVRNPLHFKAVKSLFLLKGGVLLPFQVEKISLSGSTSILTFQGISTYESALELKGSSIFLPLDQLPDLGTDDFYLHELIGLQILDQSHGCIGVIEQLYNLPKNDLFSFTYMESEVLVPINSPFIIQVNKQKKTILVDLPEGYLDVYTIKETKGNDQVKTII